MRINILPIVSFLCLSFLLALGSCTTNPAADTGNSGLLVFSKTEGFRHQSIPAGIEALAKMAAEKGLEVTFTEDAGKFTDNSLRSFRAVIFLNTTGDVLNPQQQVAFERYIQAGGGYVGIHAATDTEYDWPWYGQLAGAYFQDHPSTPSNVQEGKFYVLEKNMWATEGMPDTFLRTDEFYSFKNISSAITPVLAIDETSYVGGSNPDFHPISWYQEFDGGRSFYTAMGHTDETFVEPLFLNHLSAGIDYATGGSSPSRLDYEKSRPEENRFAKVVLADKLDEPMEMALLDEERILFIQRKGEVRLFNTNTEELTTIANLPVSLVYKNEDGENSRAEDGLLGLNKDPGFADNGWIYLYYSAPDKSVNRLSRFQMVGDELKTDSEKMLLEVEVQRKQCCHTGGSIDWDAQGNLYLSTGDNTNPHGSDGFSPSDERPGRAPWDAQKSSANTNDLRGKILRIHPEADGSYTIPAGNLFPEGTAKTRPEIYTMGHRNPFRISVDKKTGYVYWGDVGPDARASRPDRGPAGHDEVGQARSAGNFGWPHFVGNNKAYHKYDFAREVSGQAWDAAAPKNTSPNNTGLETLPPAKEAFIWYPYANSEEFPSMGTGGRNAMAGPVFYTDDFTDAERPFPKYYDGKLLAYEWMRGFIMAVDMDDEGNLVSMDRFMPSYTFSNPMDMTFAANGDLYMLEYGTGWFTQNDDARLIRIEYNGGNRPPNPQLMASTLGGATPLTVNVDATETMDADNDEISYKWAVSSDNGFSQNFTGPEQTMTLSEPGVYTLVLTADDGNGGVATQSVDITAGNELPVVALDILEGSPSFYVAGQPIRYDVRVSDAEDGSLNDGIDARRVAFSVDYLAEGFDKVAVAMGHRSADDGAMLSRGERLMADTDCQSCHKVAEKSIGPSYREISVRYADQENALEYLAGKIISGGGGVWGENAMAAHPDLATDEAAAMASYILDLAKAEAEALPLSGEYVTTLPEGDPGKGVFILRAAYQDKGAKGLPALSSEQTVVLRNAKVDVHSYDAYESVNKMSFGGMSLFIPSASGSYVALHQVSLKGVTGMTILATAPVAQLNAMGGAVEIRLDGPDGPLLGASDFMAPSDKGGFQPNVLQVPIEVPAATTGLHDVYLVFTHPDGATGSLMVVMGTTFNLAAPVAQ